jgi:hypothetical protein
MPVAFAPPRALFAVRRYVLRAPEGAALPPFAGSTLRGAVGRALRGLVCATKMPVCEGCPVRSACVYATLHDGYTPPDVHAGTGLHAPPPLWLRDVEPGRQLAAGDTTSFSMAAFGSAVRSLPFVDEAIRSLARTGIGRGRQAVELVAIEDEARADLAALVEARTEALRRELQAEGSGLVVRLRTPVAIRLKNRPWADPSRPDPPWPERLVAGAARRCRALERRWLETPSAEAPSARRAIEDAAGLVVLDEQIRFDRVRRYSFAEGRPVEFHGAVGWLKLGGEGLPRALPWLVAGELLSLGSGTTFGFGRIALGAE